MSYAGESGAFAAATVACACWCLGAAGFLYLAKLNGLAVTGAATAVASLLATVAVGIVFFGETLAARQLVGICAAVLGVILNSPPLSS